MRQSILKLAEQDGWFVNRIEAESLRNCRKTVFGMIGEAVAFALGIWGLSAS